MSGAGEPEADDGDRIGGDHVEIAALDLLLGQGTPAAQDELRARIGAEPRLALEMADTVTLLEKFRELRVEPSPTFAARLADVVARAARRRRRALPRRVPAAWLAAAAALVTFAGLFHWDPLAARSARRTIADELVLAAAPVSQPATSAAPGAAPPSALQPDAARAGAAPVGRADGTVAWQPSIAEMRRWLAQEPSRRLCEALEVGLQPAHDPLRVWLEPRNALARLRVDHERCATAAVRQQALRAGGGLVAADARVQALADQIAAELAVTLSSKTAVPEPGQVAMALRALVAAGPGNGVRSGALELGGEWLAAQLPACTGAPLLTALAALVEVAAVSGAHADQVALHGERLVHEVLCADERTWGRQRPELLSPHVPAATVGDGGRLLRLLPGFGVDVGRCALVRQLMLAQLRERTDRKQDGPEVVAAIVFGSADLLAPGERDEMEMQLRRWHPARLVPDFLTVHQLAWSIEPGRPGFTRMQRDLRQLAVLSEPEPLRDRAAFCLCLATNYAAFRGSSGDVTGD
ncbi:MAG TPA: hypothetical protein VFT55_10175 [Planctomycetota bacterium]|nr:hypothetical protein [Planctomycetota bacterium]